MVSAVDSGIYKRLKAAGFVLADKNKGEQVKQVVRCSTHQEEFKVIPTNFQRHVNGAGLCYGCTNEQVKAVGVMATFTATVGTHRAIKPWDYPKRLAKEFQARFDERLFKHEVLSVSADGCHYRCAVYKETRTLPLNWFRGWARPNCSCAEDGRGREGMSGRTLRRKGVRYILCLQHGEQPCHSSGNPRCPLCDQEQAQKETRLLERRRQPLIKIAQQLGYTFKGLEVLVCAEHRVNADLASPTFRLTQLVCKACLEKRLQDSVAAELWKVRGRLSYRVSPTQDVLVTLLFSSNNDWSVRARFSSINVAASKPPQIVFTNAQEAEKRYTGQAFQLGLGAAVFGKVKEKLRKRNPELTLLSAGLRVSASISVRHTCGFVWSTSLANIIAGQSNCPTCARQACGSQSQVRSKLVVQEKVEASKTWRLDHWETGQNKSRKQQPVCACRNCGTVRSFPEGFSSKVPCQMCHPLRSHASKAELDWLASIQLVLKIDLVSAATGKQHSVVIAGKRLRLDGYSAKHNTAFEFLGDYWHGRNEPSRYMKSMQRLARLSQLMDVVYIWESDFNRGKLLSGKLTGQGKCPV